MKVTTLEDARKVVEAIANPKNIKACEKARRHALEALTPLKGDNAEDVETSILIALRRGVGVAALGAYFGELRADAEQNSQRAAEEFRKQVEI